MGHVSPPGQAAVAQQLVPAGLVVRRRGRQAARRDARLAGCPGASRAVEGPSSPRDCGFMRATERARLMHHPKPAALLAIWLILAPSGAFMAVAGEGARHGLSAFGEL